MNTFNQILRGLLFFVLAIFGMAMAFIFMVSTAIAIGILFIVAKIKGRPFGARAYWEARQRAAAASASRYRAATQPSASRFGKQDVVDVEMREIR
ncbi:hypothetical protein [Neopusillimonas aromaticivorans]|jgi:hypothetical protein|uniref:hypothetical protein n=1 Tax=Neopusillimonas aromaticivorans TaxID=2979868 RepID=UPI002594F539|nr:hypothetical protein [Neopusillimonas aromaticivorans]NLZ10371.1 hypothetical protein [Alcaligenaceae bacterium]WJJ94223.1 hypothetical protein N7E01_03920 [Neopusillimonas aromaticivorans]